MNNYPQPGCCSSTDQCSADDIIQQGGTTVSGCMLRSVTFLGVWLLRYRLVAFWEVITGYVRISYWSKDWRRIHPIDTNWDGIKAHVRTELAIVVYNWRIDMPQSPFLILDIVFFM